jgi:hypothetical protein
MPRYRPLCSVCGLAICGCLLAAEIEEAMHPRHDPPRVVFTLALRSPLDHAPEELPRSAQILRPNAANVASGSVVVTPGSAVARAMSFSPTVK